MVDLTAGPVQVSNVLVPLDGSDLALRALPTARALADRFAATVRTVTVVGAGDDIQDARAHAAEALGVAPGDDRAAVLVGEDVAEVIEGHAGTLDPCIVCIVSRGRGRIAGALIGSVARSLLQRSTRPIVVLGPRADDPGRSPRPRNWPEPLTVPRIVACVDGSAASEQILPIAASWAEALSMALSIVTIVDDAPPPIIPDPKPGPYGDHGDAATYLEHLAAPLREQLPAVDAQVVRDPLGVASGLRAHLDEQPAGLVALTSHARSGMQRFILGATGSEIVHASVAPCLVLPLGSGT